MAGTYDYENVFVKYFDKKGLVNQYFAATPLWDRIYSKRQKRKFDSRRPIYIGLEITGKTPAGYGELDTFTRERTQITHAAYAQPANYHVDMNISWTELKNNGSPRDMVSLMKAKAKNVMSSWSRTLTTEFLTGAGTDNTLLGIDSIVTEDGTGTVQGVNGATAGLTWWANKYINGGDVVITLPSLHKVVIEAADGDDKPTVLLTDKYLLSYILTTLFQAKERYTDGTTKHAAKMPLIYDIPTLTDEALETSGATSGNIWALNENYLYFLVHPKDDLKRHSQVRPANQMAYSTDWTLEGQMVCTKRKRQCLGHSFAV